MIKIVKKTISPQREQTALAQSTKSGFAVAFGSKELFSTLRIEITREAAATTHIFEIACEHLPCNKGNSTRFRLVESPAGVQIKWCRKVASNMVEVQE